ncbi:MAG: hypothetical protein QOD25_1885 [Alphaproteobacteria bacterium]|nr:hypothetical protein [Alphaproteobacteria bacterium]
MSNRDIGFVQPGQDTDHHRHLQFHPLRPPARPVAHALAGRGHARFAISFRTFQVCPKDLPHSGSQTEPAGGRRRAVRGEYFSVVCQFEFFEGGANHRDAASRSCQNCPGPRRRRRVRNRIAAVQSAGWILAPRCRHSDCPHRPLLQRWSVRSVGQDFPDYVRRAAAYVDKS